MTTANEDADEREYRQRLQRALGQDLELRDLIGRGGFGAVYSAWDRKLERDVAVKALRHDLFPTRLVLERFQREARAVAKLRHANILPVYAVGEGDGLAYMIMPVIRGSNLRTLLDGKRAVDTESTVRIIVEVARALEAAHRLGIIHRDVKPENVLLEGDERHALLSDFGIAKSADGDGSLTGSGVILGSPHYMSPEQASAEKTLDGRSDVYSMGVIAYEMLAGRRPFEATSLQQLLVQQFTTEPAPLAQLAPSAPRALGDAVMRALARDPAQRWQSAGEFAAAVTAAGAPATVVTGPASSWFARRGLLVGFLYWLGIWSAIIAMPLSGAAAAAGNQGMEDAISLLRTPIQILVPLALLFLVGEFFAIVFQSRRSGVAWPEIHRRLWLQPGWWQPWYPRALRSADSVWDRMPLSMKALRTVLWLSLAANILAAPYYFAIPRLAGLAAGAALPLPLPVRIVIGISSWMTLPIAIGFALVVLGVAIESARHRMSPVSVLRHLFTWRAAGWDNPAGRRLLTS
ncbi:MAG: serine/threonine-protein kinase [Gemmatimonadota bacterium]